jgi:hypothetical protein
MGQDGKLILVDKIEPLIHTIRGHKVLLDSDLAVLYGVPTKRLNEQVRRNRERFPLDFRFRLTSGEKAEVVANCDHLGKLKFSPQLPYAFTEHGAIMAASVLNSPQAVEVSVFVVRAFVKLRQWMASHKELADKLTELERKFAGHDEAIRQLVTAIRQLMAPPAASKKRPIGFHATSSDTNPTSKTKARRK